MDLLLFVLALSFVVLMHELGHFWASKLTGVRVDEFGLGLPPRIFGKKIGETIYSINWLPIGGFCKLYGEEGGGGGKRAFHNKSVAQRALITVGGVLMNLVTAIAVFMLVYTIAGVPQETNKVKIIGVADGSPAMEAGLKEGDWICKADSVEIKNAQELIETAEKYKGEEIELTICDEVGTADLLSVHIRENPPEGEGAMGVAISTTEMVKVPWWQFYKGIGAGFREAYYWGKIILSGVIDMITGLVMGQVPKDISGPVGMYQATSSIKENQGLLAVFHFFGVVAVNLAVVNMLPFPALDGGRLVFLGIEAITGKKVSTKIENMINGVGMALLMLMLVLVTLGDVRRILGF